MSLLIELTPDEEAAVRARAAKQGVDVSAFVREKLFPVTETASDVDAEAADFARWKQAGQNAAEAATDRLTKRGIGYVYGRNGSVYRRRPDGTEEAITGA